MSAIPFVKMGTLLLKQASKPFASNFKKYAHTSPALQGLCMSLGRFWNRGTTRINMMTLGHKVKKVKPLSDEDAIIKGADLLGEGIVYSAAVAAVFLEYRRKDIEADEKKQKALEKEAAQQAALEARFKQIEDKIETLAAALAAKEKSSADAPSSSSSPSWLTWLKLGGG